MLQNHGADVATEAPTPNVVIGVIAETPSAPPASVEAVSADAPDAIDVAPKTRDTLVAPPLVEGDDADANDAEREAEARLKVEAAAVAEEKLETLDSTPPEPPAPSDPPPAIVAEHVESVAAVVIETKAEEPKAETPAKAIGEDDESIPPAGDLAAVQEEFFSQGDVSSLAPPDVEDDLDAASADKVTRKRAPEVVQRRAKLARYVTWAVGVSAVVCLAAVARTAVSPAAKSAANAAPTKAAMVVDRAPAPKAAVPAEVAPKPAEPAAPAEEAKPVVAGDAKEEKAACKTALEHRKLADAIEAGERAVALDETDGEAWLLLGASYQEKGDLANARKSYGSCVKLAKTKHTRECAQMLR